MNYTIKSMHNKEKCEKINKFTILLLTDETRLNYIEYALANCGVAFLSNNADAVKSTYKIIRQKWLDLSNNMSGQVQRVAGDRFAVLETALYLAKDLTQWTEEESAQAILKNFLNWKEEFGENSREETSLIRILTDWLLVNEASFIEYPADPNARKPIKASGVRVLANEAKKEEEHYFIYPKIFDEIIEGFP